MFSFPTENQYPTKLQKCKHLENPFSQSTSTAVSEFPRLFFFNNRDKVSLTERSDEKQQDVLSVNRTSGKQVEIFQQGLMMHGNSAQMEEYLQNSSSKFERTIINVNKEKELFSGAKQKVLPNKYKKNAKNQYLQTDPKIASKFNQTQNNNIFCPVQYNPIRQESDSAAEPRITGKKVNNVHINHKQGQLIRSIKQHENRGFSQINKNQQKPMKTMEIGQKLRQLSTNKKKLEGQSQHLADGRRYEQSSDIASSSLLSSMEEGNRNSIIDDLVVLNDNSNDHNIVADEQSYDQPFQPVFPPSQKMSDVFTSVKNHPLWKDGETNCPIVTHRNQLSDPQKLNKTTQMNIKIPVQRKRHKIFKNDRKQQFNKTIQMIRKKNCQICQTCTNKSQIDRHKNMKQNEREERILREKQHKKFNASKNHEIHQFNPFYQQQTTRCDHSGPSARNEKNNSNNMAQHHFCMQSVSKSLQIIDKLTKYSNIPNNHQQYNYNLQLRSKERKDQTENSHARTLQQIQFSVITISMEMNKLVSSVTLDKLLQESTSTKIMLIKNSINKIISHIKAKQQLLYLDSQWEVFTQIQKMNKIIHYMQMVQQKYKLWKMKLYGLMERIKDILKVEYREQMKKIEDMKQHVEQLKESKFGSLEVSQIGIVGAYNHFVEKQIQELTSAIRHVINEIEKGK